MARSGDGAGLAARALDGSVAPWVAGSGARASGGSLENPHERTVRRTAIIIATRSLGTGAVAFRTYSGAPAGPADQPMRSSRAGTVVNR